MALHKRQSALSVEDYLAGEKDSPIRHEYVDGQVYAMAGTTDRHNRIALNIASQLNEHLADSECEAFISDVKVEAAAELYYYPDVMVACDPPEGDRYTKKEPVLIVEVLSPSSRRIDRHEKLLAYQRIATLREYALVAQDRRHIELHRRVSKTRWQQEILTQPDEQVRFDSVGLTLTLEQIYRRVRFDEEAE